MSTPIRKTIKVTEVKEMINGMLASEYSSNEEKSVLCLALEDILHRTGNYQGFGYLNPELTNYTDYARRYF